MRAAAIVQAPQTAPGQAQGAAKGKRPAQGFGTVLDGKAAHAQPAAAPGDAADAIPVAEGVTRDAGQTGWMIRDAGMRRDVQMEVTFGRAVMPDRAPENTDAEEAGGGRQRPEAGDRNEGHPLRAASALAQLRRLAAEHGDAVQLGSADRERMAEAGAAAGDEPAADVVEDDAGNAEPVDEVDAQRPEEEPEMVAGAGSQLLAAPELDPARRRPAARSGDEANAHPAGGRKPSVGSAAMPVKERRADEAERAKPLEPPSVPATGLSGRYPAPGGPAGAAGGASAEAATAVLKAQLSAAAAPLTAEVTLRSGITLPPGSRGGAVEIRESDAPPRAAATGRVRDATASLGLFAATRRGEEAEGRMAEPRTRERMGAAGEAGGETRKSAPAALERQSAAAALGAAGGFAAVAPTDFGRFMATELRAQAPAQAAAGMHHLSHQAVPKAGGMRQLDVQLHPAELGAVAARITMAGERISVEIAAETPEAQRQLAAEGDTIRQALEALGFSVDALSIRLPDAAGFAAGAEQPAQGRDAASQSFAGAGGQAGESARGEGGDRNGQAGGRAGGSAGGGNGGEADAQARGEWMGRGMARAGAGGVYI